MSAFNSYRDDHDYQSFTSPMSVEIIGLVNAMTTTNFLEAFAPLDPRDYGIDEHVKPANLTAKDRVENIRQHVNGPHLQLNRGKLRDLTGRAEKPDENRSSCSCLKAATQESLADRRASQKLAGARKADTETMGTVFKQEKDLPKEPDADAHEACDEAEGNGDVDKPIIRLFPRLLTATVSGPRRCLLLESADVAARRFIARIRDSPARQAIDERWLSQLCQHGF